MRAVVLCTVIATLVAGLAACKPEPPPAPARAPVDMSPSTDPSVTASYVCDDVHRIDLIGERNARITLSDGQTVTIDYVPNSRPRSYMGRGLRFAIGDKAVMLMQNDGVSVACKPID